MFTVIVGENASGKTLYLDKLYGENNAVYNKEKVGAILRPLDMALIDSADLDLKVIGNSVITDSVQLDDVATVSSVLNMMFRKSDILLLDELDAYVNEYDKHMLYKAARAISKHKDVYAVSHDEEITIYADKVCKVSGDSLRELTREEMLWEIYQDEEMVKI